MVVDGHVLPRSGRIIRRDKDPPRPEPGLGGTVGDLLYAALHGIYGYSRAELNGANQLGDRACLLLLALGELADLTGDHREASSMLAGPGHLDGGVQRQQVSRLADAMSPIASPS
jgi:hypothetical protein